jgi:hypothetical protein
MNADALTMLKKVLRTTHLLSKDKNFQVESCPKEESPFFSDKRPHFVIGKFEKSYCFKDKPTLPTNPTEKLGLHQICSLKK